MKPVCTIGYEGAGQADVIAALKSAHVDLLVDVRAVVSSRRLGFAKSALKAGMEENGIEYIHLRGLGTPKEGRDAARRGDMDTLSRVYEKQLQTPEAELDMAKVIDLSRTRSICLLCYEHDHKTCHRDMVADRIVKKTGQKIVHLHPDGNL